HQASPPSGFSSAFGSDFSSAFGSAALGLRVRFGFWAAGSAGAGAAASGASVGGVSTACSVGVSVVSGDSIFGSSVRGRSACWSRRGLPPPPPGPTPTAAAGATLAAAGTAPPLPHRAEALAVGAAPGTALTGCAEPFQRTAAAAPRVLVAQARVGVAEALRHDLALVDPDLDADPAGRRLRLDEAVVDVGADRVQRNTALAVLLAPAHLAAAEAAVALDLHAGGAGADRGRERALHGAPEGDAVRQLLGDRLGDELRVELGPLDLVDVDVDV